jgi:serine/arginine repetitive matrix protein 1
MQINLTGFLTKDTPAFMSALWKLLLEAQEEVSGVPRTFVEMKKEEMRRARENDTRAIDERDRRSRLDEMRDGDGRGGRGGRGRGGRGRGRGGRGGFDDDRGGRPRDGGWGARGGGPGGVSGVSVFFFRMNCAIAHTFYY